MTFINCGKLRLIYIFKDLYIYRLKNVNSPPFLSISYLGFSGQSQSFPSPSSTSGFLNLRCQGFLLTCKNTRKKVHMLVNRIKWECKRKRLASIAETASRMFPYKPTFNHLPDPLLPAKSSDWEFTFYVLRVCWNNL